MTEKVFSTPTGNASAQDRQTALLHQYSQLSERGQLSVLLMVRAIARQEERERKKAQDQEKPKRKRKTSEPEREMTFLE